jgi:hypothetical protein
MTKRRTKIILVLPSVSDLQVMVLHNEVDELVEEMPRFPGCQTVDALHMCANGENALPSRDGIGTHDRVNSREVASDVFRGSPRSFMHTKTVGFGCFVEFGLGVGCGKAVKKALQRGRDAVVKFVSRGP